MSCPSTRPHDTSGCEQLIDGNTNAVYKNQIQCLRDRFLWDKYFNINPSSENYGQEVSEIYHPSSSYEDSVNSINDENYRNGILLLLLPIPILATLILFIK